MNGQLVLGARTTLIDRAATQLMTVIDELLLDFSLPVTGGKVSKKTSTTVLLNGLSEPAYPDCTTVAVMAVDVLDPNGNLFANLGLLLP